jgi:hypothetical protein
MTPFMGPTSVNKASFGSTPRTIHGLADAGGRTPEARAVGIRIAEERGGERVSKNSTRNDLDYTLKPRMARNRGVFDPNGSFALAILLKNGTIQANRD